MDGLENKNDNEILSSTSKLSPALKPTSPDKKLDSVPAIPP